MSADRRGHLAWAAVVLGLVAAGAAGWAVDDPAAMRLSTPEALALVTAAIIGELVPLPRDHGRGVPLTLAVLGVAALLGQPPQLVAAVGATAWLVRAGVTFARGRTVRRFGALRPVLGGWAMGGLATVGAGLGGGLAIRPGGAAVPITYASILLCSGIILVALPALDAGELAAYTRARFDSRLRQLLASSWMSGAALAATAAVGAISFDVLGWSALLLMLLPLLAARAGLRREVDIRRTYDETVRAMSRLPEELGGLPPGHGLRVAELATATARALGVDYPLVRELERAAHLHELGRIELDPGEHAPRSRIARSGGAILREAGSLDTVATIIEQHRHCSVDASPREALAADILRLACDVDRGTVTSSGGIEAASSVLSREVPHNPAVGAAMAGVLHERES